MLCHLALLLALVLTSTPVAAVPIDPWEAQVQCKTAGAHCRSAEQAIKIHGAAAVSHPAAGFTGAYKSMAKGATVKGLGKAAKGTLMGCVNAVGMVVKPVQHIGLAAGNLCLAGVALGKGRAPGAMQQSHQDRRAKLVEERKKDAILTENVRMGMLND